MPFLITDPFPGAVLNHRHGRVVPEGLEIVVQGHYSARNGNTITVNGAPARCQDGEFSAAIILNDGETEITARNESCPEKVCSVRVVWDKASQPRYRLAIDDNIFFLRDLAQRRPGSLFDSFYLRGLRELNRRYGVKVVLNLFFTTPENDFTLADFPDCYRSEFDASSDWLKLAFHAHAEFPDRPYQDEAGASRLGADYDRVATEILRFAGGRAYSPTTVTHWAMVHPSAWGALVARGTRLLSGFFVPCTGSSYTGGDESLSPDLEGDCYDINCCLDEARSAWLSRHDLLKDFASGLLFSKVDLVCNKTPVEKIRPLLTELANDPRTAEVMVIVTHEQYFWPFYKNHLPDHFARCEEAIRFCAENGFQPVFFHEGIAGSPLTP